MNKILVYLEAQKEGLKRTSYEAITLALTLSENIVGVVINASNEQCNTASLYGLKEIINAKHDYFNQYSSTAVAATITQVANTENIDCVIFAANAAGLELAPRVAVSLNAGYISDCINFELQDGNVIVQKPVYAGKSVITTKIETTNHVYSIRPNVFTAVKASNPAEVSIKDFTPNLTENDYKEKVTNLAKNEGKLDVSEAEIIVSGGRGIKGPENYNLIESLAAALGGAVGASRAVVDAGWRPHNEQVRQTGKTVAPTMYIACGISGAVQHLAGMSTSKIIVAINKDKDAPIFKMCDYGIIGDIFQVIPKFTEHIKTYTGK